MAATTTPLRRFGRGVLWFVALNALGGAGSLLLFPARTDALFFWTIAPPLNAALFGALYLSGALAVARVALGGRWEPARILVPILVLAGALISLVTLLHREAFHADLRLAYWLLIYVGAPLLALLIAFQQERAGAVWAVHEPVAPAVRRIAVGAGALVLVGGLAILVRPEPVAAAWPWPTGVLMTRIFAAWFSAFGAGLLWFQVDRDWARLSLLADMLILAAGLDLLVLLVHRGSVPAPSLALWVYAGHLVALAMLGTLMHLLQRRQPRVSQVSPAPSTR